MGLRTCQKWNDKEIVTDLTKGVPPTADVIGPFGPNVVVIMVTPDVL